VSGGRTAYRLEGVRVVRGERIVLDDVDLTVHVGQRLGIVGPNGAGKLLAVLADRQVPAAGRVTVADDLSVGYLPQDPLFAERGTVREAVEESVATERAVLGEYATVGRRLASATDEHTSAALLQELGALQEELDRVGGWDIDSRVEQAMAALRCPPPESQVADASGGERRRIALCRILLGQPDVLLLDEPTNHLDADSVTWLQQHLRASAGTVIAVTHDRCLLEDVAEGILELDRGRLHSYEGSYTTYVETKAARLAVQGRKDEKRRRLLRREAEWARSKGARSATARLARYDELARAAEHARRLEFDEIQIPPGPRLGALVIDVRGISKAFGDRTLISDLSFSLPRNGILGVLGPNGVGKTTLFEMLAGRARPDAGTIVIGPTVRISYTDQEREGLNPDATAWEAISAGEEVIRVGAVEIPARAYAAAFGFTGAAQSKPVRLFSGGERGRMNLALTLRLGGNVLLLDEPANDLDIETLAGFEAALLGFPGCAVITAHDRWFLERAATHILAWEGTADDPGGWHWHEGDYASYLAHRDERGATASDRAPAGAHRRLGRG